MCFYFMLSSEKPCREIWAQPLFSNGHEFCLLLGALMQFASTISFFFFRHQLQRNEKNKHTNTVFSTVAPGSSLARKSRRRSVSLGCRFEPLRRWRPTPRRSSPTPPPTSRTGEGQNEGGVGPVNNVNWQCSNISVLSSSTRSDTSSNTAGKHFSQSRACTCFYGPHPSHVKWIWTDMLNVPSGASA